MWVFFWVMFAVVVGVFASSKGRSGFGWGLLSLVISPLLGFLFVAVLPNLKAQAMAAATAAAQPGPATHVRCAACAEWVLPQAVVCKHCGAELKPDLGFEARQREAAKQAEVDDSRDYLYGLAAVGTVIGVAALASKCGG
jgi:hypothetical protein